MDAKELPPVADLLAVESEITFQGKVYKIRKSRQEEQAKFSRWLEQRARESAGRAVDLPEEIQDKLLRNLNSDIAAGEFEYGSPAYHAAVIRPFGLAKMISIQLQETHPEVTHEFAIDMVMDNYARLAGDILGRAKDDPKVQEALEVIFGASSEPFTSGPSTRPSKRRGKKSRK